MDDRPQLMSGIKPESEVCISRLDEADIVCVHALILKAFGPGRFAKTAERLRENNHALSSLSLVAKRGLDLVGCVQTWDIDLVPCPHDSPKLCFLGPIAVDQSYRAFGIGAKLISKVLEGAEALAYEAVVLVGDLEYFSRFGFVKAPSLTLPGPVDHNRILIKVCENARHGLKISGRLEAAFRGRVG